MPCFALAKNIIWVHILLELLLITFCFNSSQGRNPQFGTLWSCLDRIIAYHTLVITNFSGDVNSIMNAPCSADLEIHP